MNQMSFTSYVSFVFKIRKETVDITMNCPKFLVARIMKQHQVGQCRRLSKYERLVMICVLCHKCYNFMFMVPCIANLY